MKDLAMQDCGVNGGTWDHYCCGYLLPKWLNYLLYQSKKYLYEYPFLKVTEKLVPRWIIFDSIGISWLVMESEFFLPLTTRTITFSSFSSSGVVVVCPVLLTWQVCEVLPWVCCHIGISVFCSVRPASHYYYKNLTLFTYMLLFLHTCQHWMCYYASAPL